MYFSIYNDKFYNIYIYIYYFSYYASCHKKYYGNCTVTGSNNDSMHIRKLEAIA